MDELVPVSNPVAKAKKTPPAKASNAPAKAAAAQAMASNNNVSKFSVVDLFEVKPKYNVDASGAISIAIQDDYWGNLTNNLGNLAQ